MSNTETEQNRDVNNVKDRNRTESLDFTFWLRMIPSPTGHFGHIPFRKRPERPLGKTVTNPQYDLGKCESDE